MNKYALIMAGGKGTRLWPISTSFKPKQFLNLYNENIMINETINRIKGIYEYNNIFIVVNKEQKELAIKYIDYSIPRENIIVEPEAKNTALCIFYSSIIINKKYGNGVITILSSDHYIEGDEIFKDTILQGIEVAKQGKDIITIGIKPNYPSTGFGYIKFKNNYIDKCCEVIEFKEKPNYESAVEYINDKNYYWNSGIFIVELKHLFEEYSKYLENIYCKKIYFEKGDKQSIDNIYKNSPMISIDKGILEKTNNIKMLKGDFKWLDIGNINDLFKIKKCNNEKNVKIGYIVEYDTFNSNIYNGDNEKLIVALGLENINIIYDNNVILVANKEKVDKSSEIIERLEKDEKLKKFL